MDMEMKRFIEFWKKDKNKEVVAFLFYVIYIISIIATDLPLALNILIGSIICIGTALAEIKIIFYLDNKFDPKKDLKIIGKEILMYIPIWLIVSFIISFIMVGKPENQSSIEDMFFRSPAFYSLMIIVVGPITEEFVFRFLPHIFIKNQFWFILFSTIIFSAMHVVHDTKAFYYIWFYILDSWYFAYRYSRTKNLLVSIAIHSFGNLTGILMMMMHL
ncbi:MAG: CPBP family intramembrane metalloprotease [Clostridia bacterium]|nr:CPBP family intramembrane metalloprotease [Clostridia bacterium]